jgi:hypothetical protein
MARLTAAQYADKWGRRMKASTEDVRAGIARVTEAPGAAAARAVTRMRDNLNRAIDDGTWQAQVAGVSLEEWKKTATDKGVSRIAAGVDSALPTQAAMAERLLSAVDASVAAANKTPRGDLESNIQRSVTFQREMAARKLRRPGGR